MKRNLERNQKICRLFLSGTKNMAQLAREFNLSRPRVQQILKESEITSTDEIAQQRKHLILQIEELISQKPDITTKQIAERLDFKLRFISHLITKYKIKRDISLLMSRATTERCRNERARLTYELLYQQYV